AAAARRARRERRRGHHRPQPRAGGGADLPVRDAVEGLPPTVRGPRHLGDGPRELLGARPGQRPGAMTPVVICITDAPEERTRLARLYDGVGVLVMASDPASASAILGHLRACREVPS